MTRSIAPIITQAARRRGGCMGGVRDVLFAINPDATGTAKRVRIGRGMGTESDPRKAQTRRRALLPEAGDHEV